MLDHQFLKVVFFLNIIKVRYLRVAKYDLDKAAERIEQYFSLQREWPELYSKFRLGLEYKNYNF